MERVGGGGEKSSRPHAKGVPAGEREVSHIPQRQKTALLKVYRRIMALIIAINIGRVYIWYPCMVLHLYMYLIFVSKHNDHQC